MNQIEVGVSPVDNEPVSRRQFLKKLGVATAGALAAFVVGEEVRAQEGGDPTSCNGSYTQWFKNNPGYEVICLPDGRVEIRQKGSRSLTQEEYDCLVTPESVVPPATSSFNPVFPPTATPAPTPTIVFNRGEVPPSGNSSEDDGSRKLSNVFLFGPLALGLLYGLSKVVKWVRSIPDREITS